MMLISALVLLIGGGISFFLTYQSYQSTNLASSSEEGIAINGFDAVAYHRSARAQKGSPNFQVTWSGAIWHFNSLDHRQDFSENPEKYAPQYGGYDPYGMAMNGATQPATPELWHIKDGKLYLFYSGETRRLWQAKMPENIKKANIHWARLKQQIHYKSEMEKD